MFEVLMFDAFRFDTFRFDVIRFEATMTLEFSPVKSWNKSSHSEISSFTSVRDRVRLLFPELVLVSGFGAYKLSDFFGLLTFSS